jgi:hypothetical protein
VFAEAHKELYEMILGCILKDRFLFRQRKWYTAVPAFLREDDVWYFNSAFYDFGRKRMADGLRDVMRLPQE